jgi:hypothetical protein
LYLIQVMLTTVPRVYGKEARLDKENESIILKFSQLFLN